MSLLDFKLSMLHMEVRLFYLVNIFQKKFANISVTKRL